MQNQLNFRDFAAQASKLALNFYLIICSLSLVMAQETVLDEVLDAYESYTEAPREVAYVHLNKSTYIQGEMLAFKAYIFDKYSKEVSDGTTNLYTTIADNKGNVLRKKLIHIKNGTGANVFELDDSLSTGTYVFKAFTSWMKNFDEPNHYEQSFRIINSDNGQVIRPVETDNLATDLQVLPEGGHILCDVSNTLGIIAKNNMGFGIPFAKGSILDDTGQKLSEFQLNEMGMAKAPLMPKTNRQYRIKLNVGEDVIEQPLGPIKAVGLTLTTNLTNQGFLVEVTTNKKSMPLFRNKPLKAAIHNGANISVIEFTLGNHSKRILQFNKTQLNPGVNIVTILDDKNNPLLERMLFNPHNLPLGKISLSQVKTIDDSLNITLSSNLKNIKASSLSISVLPSGTKSYNHSDNIISKLYLQPYLNSAVQNSSQYFKNLDAKSMYELDLVLLIQGWSSYNWESIFTYNNSYKYSFERGIDVVANLNQDQKGNYIVYPLSSSNTQLFDVPENEDSFTIKSSIPKEDDLFRISYVGKKKKDFGKKPNLYLQFYPSQFPEYNKSYDRIREVFTESDLTTPIPDIDFAAEDIEVLDEVVVTGKVERTKAEELQAKAVVNKVRIIEERDTWGSPRIDIFLQRLGWVTNFDYNSNSLTIINPRVSWGPNVPAVYLDDGLLNMGGGDTNLNILTFLTLDYVDYIDYNLYGTNGGLLYGQAGYIKIYTSPNRKFQKNPNGVVTYEVPLQFSRDKEFYTPKYKYYSTRFYNEYGTVAWFDDVQLDNSGNLTFKVPNFNDNELELHVEGLIGENQLISERIVVSAN